MSQTLSIFEQLIGENFGAFHIMMEGALKNWQGSYDVILVEEREYLLRAKNQNNFSPYCHRLRAAENGEQLCLDCDLFAAIESGKHPDEGWVHLCDGGLLDIAAPIIIEGKLVAAILCGQTRPADPDLEEEGRKQTLFLQQKFGIENNELLELRFTIPSKPLEEMKETSKRLAQMTRFVSQVLATQLEIQRKKTQLEQVAESQTQVIERLRKIENALSPLLSLQNNLNDLWLSLDACLQKVSALLNASNAAFLFYDSNRTEIYKTTLQSMAWMPAHMQRGLPVNHDAIFLDWDQYEVIHIAPFRGDNPDTLCAHLLEERLPNSSNLNSTLTIKVRLASEETLGLLVFFFEEEEPFWNGHFDEQTEFTLIASSISQAYNNTIAYIQQVNVAKQRQEWIKRIEHQLISPLNGVLGHAGRLKERFDELRTLSNFSDWREEDATSWQNNIFALIDTTEWTVTLTRNLTWMADLERSRLAIKQGGLEIISNVPHYLIECARYFQGVAHDYHLWVHVDENSAAVLNDRLQIYPAYFRMAIQNLLDNAVKYSTRGTEVGVIGEATNGHGRIRVINTGIRIFPEECQRIFDYGYRSKSAQIRRKPGTGIGLSIAQEIIRLHGGLITAQPSELVEGGWRTTMTVTLPIIPGKGR